MTPLEVILTFLVVMGVISIPIAAIVMRKGSPVGEAIADRIRRRTDRRLGQAPGRDAARSTDPPALIEDQQRELRDMSARLDFLERLVEDRDAARNE